MKKRLLWIFLAVVSTMVVAAAIFVQSERFARIVKSVLVDRLPIDQGIEGDFSHFEISLFPPALAVANPVVTVSSKNLINLPPGSKVEAQKIELRFYPLQLFSGNIRIHEVAVVGGNVDFILDPEKLEAASQAKGAVGDFAFRWEDLIDIRAESVVFEDSSIRFSITSPKISGGLEAKYLRIKQVVTSTGGGVELFVNLEDIQGQFPKEWDIPQVISRLEALAFLDQSGLKVDQFKLDSVGLELSLKGKLEGDVLQGKNLELASKVMIRGDVQNILGRLKLKKLQTQLQGGIEFKGELDGNLSRFMETVRADGVFTGTDIRYQDWKSKKITAKGRWLSAIQVKRQAERNRESIREKEAEQSAIVPKQAGVSEEFVGPPRPSSKNAQSNLRNPFGEISISQIEIESPLSPRRGAHQAGHGGQVSVGQFSIPLSGLKELTVPISLDQAHIHWLAAPVLADVFPLDFRASGKIKLDLKFDAESQLTSIDPQLDLKIRNFVLDNQKLGVARPVRKLLQIPAFELKGSANIKDGVLTPGGDLTLFLPETELKVSGKISGKTGYDLHAFGKINLKDFETLSETPIRGSGELRAHIHGLTSKLYLDFFPKLRDAAYLDLQLGDLDGKVSYEDFSEILRFEQVKLSQGRTKYLGNGRLELAGDGKSFLDFRFDKGDISDISVIFSNLVDDISWYPHSLTGEFDGNVVVRGGLSNELLSVRSNVNGRFWDYYGERLASVSFQGGYEKGLYFLENFKGTKYKGQITGEVSFNEKTEELKWRLNASHFTLNDLDHIARLDVPVRGVFDIYSQGHQTSRGTQSESRFNLSQVVVRGVSLPPSSLEMITDRNVLKIKGNANGGQGALSLNYDFREGSSSDLKLEAKKLDFSPVILLLNSSLMQDSQLKGHVSGLLELKFNTGKAELASGKVRLDEYLLQKRGQTIRLEEARDFQVADGSFSVASLNFIGDKGKIQSNLQARRGNLSGRITGSLSVSTLEFLVAEVQRGSGDLEIDLALGGNLKEPWLVGKVGINDSSLKLASFEQSFDSLNGLVRVNKSLLELESLSGLLSGSPLDVGGKVEVFKDRFPRLDLNATLRDNRIAVYPFQFMTVSGKIRAVGESLPYQVTGDLQIKSAISRVKMLSGDGAQTRKSSRFTPSSSSIRGGELPLFQLNLSARGESDILVMNDLFDAELSANVRLINTIDAPVILGEARLLRGQMKFKDQVFSIRSARINFNNPNTINPEFNLSAFTQVKKTKINLYASGTMEKWKIDLSSDPAKPEAEILQLLALGISPEDLRRLKGESDTLLQQGEAMMLLLHSLDFNRNVKEKTGFEIELQESYDTQSPNRIFENPTTQETYSAPKIVIKRKIGEKVGISLGTTVGVGNVTEREVNAEFEVGPGVSVNGVWNDFEGADTNTNKQESYGVDLKFQKRFK